MNSFMKIAKWIKSSSFGLILTSIALVFVICVGIIINQSNSVEVAKPTESVMVEDSLTESTPSQEEPTQQPTIIEKVQLPFTVNATIARYFFDSSDSIEIKSQALVNYDNKFIPSLGVDYIYENEQFEVVSSFEGVVVEKRNDALYGLTVVVENEEGLKAHYSGLSNVNVFENETIKQGQVIAKVGSTGYSTGPHLHFSVYKNSKLIDPMTVLK